MSDRLSAPKLVTCGEDEAMLGGGPPNRTTVISLLHACAAAMTGYGDGDDEMMGIKQPDHQPPESGHCMCTCLKYAQVLSIDRSLCAEMGLLDPAKRVVMHSVVSSVDLLTSAASRDQPPKQFGAEDFVYGDHPSAEDVSMSGSSARRVTRDLHCCSAADFYSSNAHKFKNGPGLSIVSGTEPCCCHCHKYNATYALSGFLHQGFTSTVIGCHRILELERDYLCSCLLERRRSGPDDRTPLVSDLLCPPPLSRYIDGAYTNETQKAKVVAGWLTPLVAHEHIVIKMIHKARCDPQEQARCLQETKYLAFLRHRNVVRLLASFDGANELWMFFERAIHGDLEGYMEESRTFKEVETRAIVRQILHALYYCHARRIIHGDLKPKNILVFGEYQRKEPSSWTHLMVKLADFGLATMLPPERSKKRFDSVQGSHGYFAPEILLRRDYDFKVDMWALGIITFQLLGGYHPWYPASACISEDLRFEDRVWATVSPAAKDFIHCLLSYQPNDRLSAEQALYHEWFITAREGCEMLHQGEHTPVPVPGDMSGGGVPTQLVSPQAVQVIEESTLPRKTTSSTTTT